MDEVPRDVRDSVRRLVACGPLLTSGTRLEILACLAERSRPVADLAASIDLDASTVSHALAVLRRLELVVSRRDRWSQWYALTDHVRVTHAEDWMRLEIKLPDGARIDVRVGGPSAGDDESRGA